MNNELFQLLFCAQNGDKKATEKLYLKFSKLIKKLSRLAEYDGAETDIIVFFLQFIKKVDLKKLENKSTGEIINYIYISLKNYTFSLMKQSLKKKIDECNIIADQLYYDSYEKFELTDSLDSLKKLTKIQKQIILDIYLYNYKISEIAKLLNVSRQAVNQNKIKALKVIEKELVKKGDR